MKRGATAEGSAESHYDSKAVDIYAMGVCLFEMLNLCQPYPADKKDSTVAKIVRQEIRYLEKVPKQCRELIASMLRIDPGQRPKANDVLKNGWLEKNLIGAFLTGLGLSED